jgi:hypothetical protein
MYPCETWCSGVLAGHFYEFLDEFCGCGVLICGGLRGWTKQFSIYPFEEAVEVK